LFRPFKELHLSQVIPDIVIPSVFSSSKWSSYIWLPFIYFLYNAGFRLSIYVSVPAQSLGFNPLNAELNPICYLLALLAHHFLHVSRITVKSLTLKLLMSYIYGAPILDVSRSHTTTQHSR